VIHILLGNAAEDVDAVLDAGKSHKPLHWIVPKTAHVDDPALMHLPARGFAARAVVATEPRETKRRGRYAATIRAVKLLTPAVPLAFIRKNHPSWEWPSYPKGYVTVDGRIERRLEQLIRRYRGPNEGLSKSVLLTKYERDRDARRQCIAHYGTACHTCGLSFGETYGDIAEGFIHVHHLKTVASHNGKKHPINPVKDLRPVCPSCHAVIHLQTPPLSIPRLKRILEAARS
jgi:hypothetical protein